LDRAGQPPRCLLCEAHAELVTVLVQVRVEPPQRSVHELLMAPVLRHEPKRATGERRERYRLDAIADHRVDRTVHVLVAPEVSDRYGAVEHIARQPMGVRGTAQPVGGALDDTCTA